MHTSDLTHVAWCMVRQVIVRRGQEMDTAYYVVSGSFATFAHEVDPNMEIPSAEYATGEAICPGALERSRPAPFQLRCLDAGELLCLKGAAFRAIADHSAEASGDSSELGHFLHGLPYLSKLSLAKCTALGDVRTLRHRPHLSSTRTLPSLSHAFLGSRK
jgi:CRP-like cAMP-binding protein